MSAEILDKACQGDRNAFSALVAAHYDFIHAVAWRWCGSESDAEDIAQDVCIRLGKAIRSFKGQSAFRTWLYTLTLNAVRDHQRQSSRRRRDQDRLANDPIGRASSRERVVRHGETAWSAGRQHYTHK
ncbi:RNA polymerase sigma factor [Neorhizobium galegae]|uniref:RNA polymerase sigma factor n=1 Tax=Neorhizobium galegae TaxID=399 RepID=UPI003F6EA0A0